MMIVRLLDCLIVFVLRYFIPIAIGMSHRFLLKSSVLTYHFRRLKSVGGFPSLEGVRVLVCRGQFPPLAGVRGWKSPIFDFFHPPTPASGGEPPANFENLCKNFSIWKFSKTELNSPTPFAGVRGRIIITFLFLCSINSYAHEIRPAYLEIKQTTQAKYQVLWKIPLLGNKAPKIDPILPDNFTLKQIDDEFLPDAYIRKYEGNYTEGLNGKEIGIKGLDLTLVDVLVQITLLDESSYTLLLQPDKAQAIIPKEPNKWEVIQLYIFLGIEHILIGIDHLLFVLGLLLLVKGIKPLIQTITAFTLAHSITLGAATFDFIKVPQAPVEAVIALSIVFLAREYISLKEGKVSLTAKHPWIVAFTFGLLHGFGFAGALSEIGFPQKEVPLALFTFNVGVELGQLIFIGIILLFWQVLKKINIPFPEWTWKILPYGMGIIASFWLVERVVAFW